MCESYGILIFIFIFPQLFLTIITASLQLVSPAPTHMQEFEILMLNQLNKSWYKPKPPHEYPLKGEYPCEGGICRTEARRRLFKDWRSVIIRVNTFKRLSALSKNNVRKYKCLDVYLIVKCNREEARTLKLVEMKKKLFLSYIVGPFNEHWDNSPHILLIKTAGSRILSYEFKWNK